MNIPIFYMFAGFHTHPLHILIGQKNRTQLTTLLSMESPFQAASINYYGQIHQMATFVSFLAITLRGEYRSTTSLKHTHPLHILIGHSNTTHQ